MGTPVKRVSKPKKATIKGNRSISVKSDFFIPRVTELDLQELNGGQDDLSFYSLVGHTNLDPYAWVSLDNTNEFFIQIKRFQALKEKKPNSAGMISMTYKNEYKKFPHVEFEFTEPDYRKISSEVDSVNGGSGLEFGKSFISKRLEKMKYGRVFYIRFGYSSSHVQYGPFTVFETDLKFESGTAICKVKGRLGQKLRSVSTVKYYSNTSPIRAINEIANLSGIRINTKDLLKDELEDISKATENMSSQVNAGQFFDSFSDRFGIDLYYDPRSNSLRFDSAFKLELLNRGKKPYKMSYGFPSSSIDKIEVKVYRPKKKKRKTGGKLGMTQEKRDLEEKLNKAQTKKRIIHGFVQFKSSTGAFISTRLSSSSNLYYVDERVVTQAGSAPAQGTIEYLNSKFLNDENMKYTIERSGVKVDGGKKEFFNIYQYVDTGEKLTVETVSVNNQGLQKLVNDTTVIIQDVSDIKLQNDQFQVKVFRKDRVKKIDKQQKKSIVVNKKIVDTFDDGDGRTLVKVGEVTFTEDYRPGSGEQVEDTSLRAGRIKAYESLLQRKSKLEGIKDNVVQFRGQNNRHFALYSLLNEKSEVIEGARIHAQEDDDTKQPIEFAPKGVANVKKVSVRQRGATRKAIGKRRELKISLRAGDWTMECGRLIELTDVYKEYEGFYYVHSVEHEVGSSGFHTKLVCRVASKKMVNKKVNPDTVQGTRQKKAKEAQTTQQKAVAIRPVRQITAADQKVIKKQEDDEKKKADKKLNKRLNRANTGKLGPQGIY